MEKKIAVSFRHVNKIYKLNNSKSKNKFAKKQKFYALKDISFDIEEGCNWNIRK